MEQPENSYTEEEAAVILVRDLGKNQSREGQDLPSMIAYRLSVEPAVVAVPRVLTASEAQQLVEMASFTGDSDALSHGKISKFQGTQTLRIFAFAENPLVEEIEGRLVAAAGLGLEYLTGLRIVRPCRELGFCNRGCGPKSAYICLGAAGEEVFFPELGIRLVLEPGDAIMWPNVDWSTGQAVEDLRTLRVHRESNIDAASLGLLGLDVLFHDSAIRELTSHRTFVTDDEVAARARG